MSIEVEVRPPDPAEVDAVADMWVALAADQRAYDSHLLADANRTAVRESIARKLVGGGLRVADVDGDDGGDGTDAPAGFVSFGVDDGRYDRDCTRGVVRHLYVRPAARDRGVGRRLLDVAERALDGAGVEVVALEAMARNDAARRFYEQRGYAPHRVEFEKRVESDTRRD